MFFLIAGIQPKTVTLDDHPRRCPSCGLDQALAKRVDSYFSVFFLPILRVKKGTPFLQCLSCGHLSDESGQTWYERQQGRSGPNCPQCGKPLEPQFHFCPFCGKSL